MGQDQAKPASVPVEEIEQEIRNARKFSASEAMARMAGPGAMKGASPVSPQQQAEIELGSWIRSNITDPAGSLHEVLHRHIKASEFLLRNVDRPLAGLAEMCQAIIASDYRLQELVREADVEWGERMDERPRFDSVGAPRDPEDPYTIAWVRQALRGVVADIGDTSQRS